MIAARLRECLRVLRWDAAGGGIHAPRVNGLSWRRTGSGSANGTGIASATVGAGMETRCWSPAFGAISTRTGESSQGLPSHPSSTGDSDVCATAKLSSQWPPTLLSHPNSKRVPCESRHMTKPRGISTLVSVKIARHTHAVQT